MDRGVFVVHGAVDEEYVMSDYIERDKIGLTDFEIAMCNGDYKEGMKMLLDKIESIPAADVRENIKARWIDMGDHLLCSGCGATHYGADKNFCPNCGADMRPQPPKEGDTC